jgi:hypothetical protein
VLPAIEPCSADQLFLGGPKQFGFPRRKPADHQKQWSALGRFSPNVAPPLPALSRRKAGSKQCSSGPPGEATAGVPTFLHRFLSRGDNHSHAGCLKRSTSFASSFLLSNSQAPNKPIPILHSCARIRALRATVPLDLRLLAVPPRRDLSC